MKPPLVPSNPVIARINVTPVIDVALVLVIILLITAPIMTVKDLGVSLPEAETRGAEDELRVTVTLNADGVLAVDEDDATMQTLAGIIETKLIKSEREDLLVIIRADEDIPHEVVRRVLKEAKSAGASRLAIATRQGSEGTL